ncbi:UDP-N-acetylmuramate dehydrogenase [Oscillospiraceae bacterium 44-34]
MEQLEKLLRQRCPEMELRVNDPMSRHTTFRIGGPAALMVLPRTVGEAKAAVKTARELDVEPFFLGNGSNLLVADEGYPGFIIKLTWDFGGIREVNRGLEAGSAVLLSRLSNAVLGWGLTGLEFASGIPGSVGGAITMNAGAYGGEMAQVLESVTFLDEAGEVCTIPASKCAFDYRKSIFSDRKCLILKACFHLDQGDPAAIRARMDELAAQRREKQPLEHPSAGSMFKRPLGHFAAALIDQCGLKGFTVGGAQVSEKHAGFVVNRGGATCADVLELVRQVKEEVLRQTGVELEMEVRVLR